MSGGLSVAFDYWMVLDGINLPPKIGWLKSVKILIVDSDNPLFIHSTTDDLSCLVVFRHPSEKWWSESQLGIWNSQYMEKTMFQTTNQTKWTTRTFAPCPRCRPPGLSTSPTSWSCQVWQKSLGNCQMEVWFVPIWENSYGRHFWYPLANFHITDGKITMLWMGKSTN